MIITTEYEVRKTEIIALFRDTFQASEGLEAGKEIENLVSGLMGLESIEDMQVFLAIENQELLGCIIFTPLIYPQDSRKIVILSPVAVATNHQGKGLGQRLINQALNDLQLNGVYVIITYGDIKFYSKVGFAQITQADAQAPFELQYPEGWLGQALGAKDWTPLQGPSQCVEPLNEPVYW